VVQRIVRGYTYISRNYQPGDHIYIVGFSRGAYTARALAGMIATQGLLKTSFKSGSPESYQAATDAWFYYRNTVKVKDETLFADLMTAVLNKSFWTLVKSIFQSTSFNQRLYCSGSHCQRSCLGYCGGDGYPQI